MPSGMHEFMHEAFCIRLSVEALTPAILANRLIITAHCIEPVMHELMQAAP